MLEGHASPGPRMRAQGWPCSRTRELYIRNSFKGLDLVDRVPKELWMEVHNIVQEVVTKTIPKKKKCKKAEWLSEEALQIAEERKDVKSKGEREMYNQLNAELQQEETRRPSSMNNAKK